MSELSPRAKALFDRARQAGAPSAAERASLLERIEKAAPGGGSSPPPATPGASSKLGVVLSSVVGVVALVALVAWLGTRKAPEETTARTASDPDIAMLLAEPPLAEPPLAEPLAEPPIAEPPIAAPPIAHPPIAEPPIAPPVPSAGPRAAPPTEPLAQEPPVPAARAERRASPPAEGDDLAAELAILRRAQAARRARLFDGALAALDEHARRFPAGTLATERQVTRALVLCERGDLAQGRALAAPFASSAWSSSLARACADPAPEGTNDE